MPYIPPSLPTDETVTRFFPYGGLNYLREDVTTIHFGDTFATIEEAATEWARRRNGLVPAFPAWGEGQNNFLSDQCGVVWKVEFIGDEHGKPVCYEMTDAWELEAAEIERVIGETAHYFDTYEGRYGDAPETSEDDLAWERGEG